MRAALLLVFVVGCVPTVAPQTQHTLPDALAATELPPEPEDIPVEERWALPAEGVEVAPGDIRDGVLFSMAMALRAAQLRIAYDELRALYMIDLRTWGRERGVYERYLQLADQEIAEWRQRAQRSWWEDNGDEVALILGLVLGIGASIGIGAVMVGLRD